MTPTRDSAFKPCLKRLAAGAFSLSAVSIGSLLLCDPIAYRALASERGAGRLPHEPVLTAGNSDQGNPPAQEQKKEGKKEDEKERPPLPGYERGPDQTVLECIDGSWHEITYASYHENVEDKPGLQPVVITVKISDYDIGEPCSGPPKPPAKKLGRVSLKQCIGGFWHIVDYDVYQQPGEDAVVSVKIKDTPTTTPCAVQVPKPLEGSASGPPCPGVGVRGTSNARSVCGEDGFWHVITIERWTCSDGTKKRVIHDEKTDQ